MDHRLHTKHVPAYYKNDTFSGLAFTSTHDNSHFQPNISTTQLYPRSAALHPPPSAGPAPDLCGDRVRLHVDPQQRPVVGGDVDLAAGHLEQALPRVVRRLQLEARVERQAHGDALRQCDAVSTPGEGDEVRGMPLELLAGSGAHKGNNEDGRAFPYTI